MKNRYYLCGLVAAAFALTGCDYNEENFPGFDELAHPTHVWNDTITLTKGDYKLISKNKTNIALAEAKGEEAVKALQALEKNNCFATPEDAEIYIPALVAEKYPYMDNKSKVVVNYDCYQDLPEYLKQFNGMKSYELTTDDYKLVWGDVVKAHFLSPNSMKKLPEVLKATQTAAKSGDMLVVNYAYSATEPSVGGGGGVTEEKMVYQQVKAVKQAGGNYVILAADPTAQMIPFGRLLNESKSYGYMGGDPVEVANSLINGAVDKYVLTLKATENGYTLQRPDGKYIYMKGNYNNFNLSNELPAEGGHWTLACQDDGTFEVKNVLTGKIIKLSTDNRDKVLAFGAYLPAVSGTYLNAPMQNNDGSFTFQDVTLNGKYIWKYDNSRTDHYWKASAGKDNLKPNESWLVSTEINLQDAKNPVLSFQNAINFLKDVPRDGVIEAYILTDYAGDVTTATKNKLEGINWAPGIKWDFVESGEIDLSAFNGKKVRLAFAYNTLEKVSPTLEIMHVLVKEKVGVETYYGNVQLFEEMPESEAQAAPAMLVATRAAVQPTKSELYQFNGTDWAKVSVKNVDLTVLQPADYEALGYDFIKKPQNVLPAFLAHNYPYAKVDDVRAVVYLNEDGQMDVAEFKYDGTVWSMTTKNVHAVKIFQKVNGEWIEAKFYLDVNFADGANAFEVKNVDLGGLEFVWNLEQSRGYWKGSSYKSGSNIAAVSYLVSPEIDMTKANVPYMSINQIVNHLKGQKLEDHLNVVVSTNYTGDVASAKWEVVKINTWPEGVNWDAVTTEQISMEKYVGKKIHLAFRYEGKKEAAPTWEVLKVYVGE